MNTEEKFNNILQRVFKPSVLKLREDALSYLYKASNIIKNSDYYREFNEDNREIISSSLPSFFFITREPASSCYYYSSVDCNVKNITDFSPVGRIPTYISSSGPNYVESISSSYLSTEKTGLKKVEGDIVYTKDEYEELTSLKEEFDKDIFYRCKKLSIYFKIISEEIWKLLRGESNVEGIRSDISYTKLDFSFKNRKEREDYENNLINFIKLIYLSYIKEIEK